MELSRKDWTEGELLDHFRFYPEDRVSEDSDVLYRGELIHVESGGIQKYEQAECKPQQPYHEISEIQPDPYTINPAEIKKLF